MNSIAVIPEERLSELEKKLDHTLRYLKDRSDNNFKVYDNEALAKFLGVSLRTLQKWRDQGIITFSQVGNKIYYKLKDVEDFLKRHEKTSFKK